MWGCEEKANEGEQIKKKRKQKGQVPLASFFLQETRILKGKKVSENLLIVCVKEKLHAKRDTNKSCARVKLLLHGTTTVTRLFYTALLCVPFKILSFF